jgi:hypothetical protein
VSADRLRQAAQKIRETADAARDCTGAGDWFTRLNGSAQYTVASSGGTVCNDSNEEEAEHIALWSPSVALAVADWLDREAQVTRWPLTSLDAPMAVVDLILGGAS